MNHTIAQEMPDNATGHIETIVLGSGCFWGAEKRYEALGGVLDAVSGYADGHGFKATYRNTTRKHVDLMKITTQKLLK